LIPLDSGLRRNDRIGFDQRFLSVMPAQAGIQEVTRNWIPAFAGMMNRAAFPRLSARASSSTMTLQKTPASLFSAACRHQPGPGEVWPMTQDDPVLEK
jgi:hypothetical protein